MTDIQTRIPGQMDTWWEDGALRAIKQLAETRDEFTAADVAELVPEPDHSCRWGSVLAKAKALGLIKKVGYTASRRPSRNAGVAAVWRAA